MHLHIKLPPANYKISQLPRSLTSIDISVTHSHHPREEEDIEERTTRCIVERKSKSKSSTLNGSLPATPHHLSNTLQHQPPVSPTDTEMLTNRDITAEASEQTCVPPEAQQLRNSDNEKYPNRALWRHPGRLR